MSVTANEKASRLGKAAVSVALVVGLGACSAAPASAYAAEGQSKDEIVYAKTAADGATSGVYVVNVFDSDEALQVQDPANYTEVENLTTSDTLQQQNGTVAVSAQAGVPFYYQGTMDSSVQLPWDISVKYYLNGEEKTAEELSGANGLLKVVLDVQPATEGDAADFAGSYALQAQGTFSQDTFAVVDAGDATVAHSGSNEVATCLVLPGESATFEITGVARNFSYDGWQIAGMPLSLAVDVASGDTSQLSDATKELENATARLSSGASELSDGASAVSDGAAKVATGANQLSSGVDAAVAGLGKLSDSGKTVAQGWKQVSAGIERAVQGVASLKAGSDAFKAGLKSSADTYAAAASAAQSALAAYRQNPTEENFAAVSNALAAMDKAAQSMAKTSGASGAYQALTGVQSQYAQVAEGIDALAAAGGDLASGSSAFDEGLSAYLAGADEASAASSQLQSGAAQVANGAQSVSSATNELASGASELSGGSATLAESTNGMDQKIIDQLQQAIDEKLGQDFTPHSFVVPSNTNVDAVQFVYVVGGVEEPESEPEQPATEEEQAQKTIFDRFFALFAPQE